MHNEIDNLTYLIASQIFEHHIDTKFAMYKTFFMT